MTTGDRGFPRGGTGPHDHGDFNNVQQHFWRREFWDWRRPLPPRLGDH